MNILIIRRMIESTTRPTGIIMGLVAIQFHLTRALAGKKTCIAHTITRKCRHIICTSVPILNTPTACTLIRISSSPITLTHITLATLSVVQVVSRKSPRKRRSSVRLKTSLASRKKRIGKVRRMRSKKQKSWYIARKTVFMLKRTVNAVVKKNGAGLRSSATRGTLTTLTRKTQTNKMILIRSMMTPSTTTMLKQRSRLRKIPL